MKFCKQRMDENGMQTVFPPRLLQLVELLTTARSAAREMNRGSRERREVLPPAESWRIPLQPVAQRWTSPDTSELQVCFMVFKTTQCVE
jgi:hypothetical protein